MTRRRSSPLGLELVLSVVLALVVLPLLSNGAPLQDSHAELQRYSEGCYYNYNHYNEGDRILTNEPCLNCTCHNKMLMCYLRVCPFTKPIGHDCTVEKRADQCCPIVTCPEVPVDVSHHSHQLTTSAPGTELSIPEKYGCSIDNKFYVEGAQVPSNPNKPCELCYCIRNRTSCLMQECTLHIDGCQPIYNKGSCCPVRYNCDHENELLEIEDFSTTTTTVRPTPGYVLSSTTSPDVTTDCVHNNEVYADGASITSKNSCEHCYCMRGDIVCAVQECEMPTLESGAKTCRALPPTAGECCPSNYVCDDDSVTTEATLIGDEQTTLPMIQSDLHESVSQEDVQLQEHIDDKTAITELPGKSEEHPVKDAHKHEKPSFTTLETTISPIAGDVAPPSQEEEDVKHSEEEVIKHSEEEEEEAEKPLPTTVSAIKETSYETTQSPIEHSTTHKTEEELDESHHDKEEDYTQAPVEDEIIHEEKEDDVFKSGTTLSPVVGDIEKVEEEDLVPSKEEGTSMESEKPDQKKEDTSKITTTDASTIEKEHKKDEIVPFKDDDLQTEVTTVTSSPFEEDVKKVVTSNGEPSKPQDEVIDTKPIDEQTQIDKIVTTSPSDESDLTDKTSSTEATSDEANTVSSLTSNAQKEPEASSMKEETSSESVEFSEETLVDDVRIQDKLDQHVSEPASVDSSTVPPIYEEVSESFDSHVGMPEIGDHKTEPSLSKKKPKDENEDIDGTTHPSSLFGEKMDKDEIPETTVDSTTKHSPIQEEGMVLTSTTSSGPQEVSSDDEVGAATPSHAAEPVEFATTKPTLSEDELSKDKTTEEQQKPSNEDNEIPAIVEQITEVSIKLTAQNTFNKEDKIDQTTVIPNADEASGSQEKEVNGEPAEPLAHDDEGKPAATSRPVRINIAGEEEDFTETPSEEASVHLDEKKPEADFSGLTTVSSIPDSDSIITKKEGEANEASQGSTTSPSVVDFEKPDSEILEASGDPQIIATTKQPSLPSDTVGMKGEHLPKAPGVSHEEGDKPKKDVDGDEDETTTSPKTSQETEDEKVREQGMDHTTQPSIVSEEVTTDKAMEQPGESESKPPNVTEDINVKPQDDIVDSTSAIPLAESEEHSLEEEQVKIGSGEDFEDTPTVTPSVPHSGLETTEPEGQKKKPEKEIVVATSIRPSVSEDEVTSSEDDKDHISSTESPAIDDSGATSYKEADMKHKPGLPSIPETGTPSNDEEDLTTVSSVPKSEPPFNEQGVTNHPQVNIIDSTTSIPANADSNTSVDEDGEVKDKTTPIPASSVESEVPESEEGIKVQPEPTKEKEPEQISADSITSTTDSSRIDSESTTEEDKLHDKLFAGPKEIAESTEEQTPSIPDSGATASGEDSTTQSTSDSQPSSEEEEEIKKQPHQEGHDSTQTIVTPLEGSSAGGQPTEDLEISSVSTTVGPSITSSEKENADGQDDKPEQDIINHTTIVPAYESDDYKQNHNDILRTTLSPIANVDKESSEPAISSEDSSEPLLDIIPSAIPGEGDCLVDNKTYSNNATIPTSNECELSCSCISSIVICKKIVCYEPPQPNNCVLDEASTDRCCPQYICGIDSFTKDQRPTTPEDIEDEEIQFTTLLPTKKYPDFTVEHGTAAPAPEQPEESDAISQPEEDLVKTEKPAIAIENATSLPEQQFEEAGPYIDSNETEETSTKVATSSESTVTSTPIPTIKPTKQVTGDIEPIEISETSKKPFATDENTTFRVSSTEETVVTVTPSSQGTPNMDEEDISTKNDESSGAVDDSVLTTESSLEVKTSTSQGTKIEVTTGAPILSVGDLAHSGEVSDEVSTESEEELTDSQEATKSPPPHKEEGHDVSTIKTIVSSQTESEEELIDSEEVTKSPLPHKEEGHDVSTIKTIVSPQTESEEELIDSEEVTKSPLPHKEEGHDVSTIKTIVSSQTESEEELTDSEEVTKSPLPHKEEGHDVSTIKTIVSSQTESEELLIDSEEVTKSPLPHKEEGHDVSTIKTIVSSQTESEEELTDSEEVTKSPLPHKEEGHDVSTIKTIVSPQTEISSSAEQTDSSTIIPEIDYKKPAVPEDLSHTKFETEELPTKTESPVQPNSTEESGEMDESEETTEKTILTSKSPVSTVLFPVESTEDDTHKEKPIVEISDKKDDLPSSELDEEDKSTDRPAVEKYKPTVTTDAPLQTQRPQLENDTKKDETESHTSSPVGDFELEKERIPTQTSVSDFDKQATSGTIAPERDSIQDKDDIPSGMSTPAMEDHSIEESGTPVPSDNLAFASSTSGPSDDRKPISATHAPVSEEESNKEKESSTPAIDEHTVEGSGSTISQDEPSEIVGQTTTPAIEVSSTDKPISGDIPHNEHDESNGPTTDPGVFGVEDEKKTNVISQTSSPPIEEHLVEGSGSSISQDEQENKTTRPIIETEESGASIYLHDVQDNKTARPITEEGSIEGSGEPVSEDTHDSKTAKPTIGSGSKEESEAPISKGEQEDMVAKPISETGETGGSGAPILEEEQDNRTAKPSETDEIEGSGASISEEEQDNKTAKPASETEEIEGSGAPTSEEDQDSNVSKPIYGPGPIEGTVSPTSEYESGTERESVLGDTVTPSSESSAVSSTESQEESKTNAPGISGEPELSSPASEKPTVKIESQTSIPVKSLEDSSSPGAPTPQTTEIEDLSTQKPSSDDLEEDLSGTPSTPVDGNKHDEADLPGNKDSSTAVPTKHTDGSLGASEAPIELLPSKHMDKSDENTDSATTPVKDIDVVESEDKDSVSMERTTARSDEPEKETEDEIKTSLTSVPTKTTDSEEEVFDATTSVSIKFAESDDGLSTVKSPESVSEDENFTKSPGSDDGAVNVTKSTDLDSDNEFVESSTQAKVEEKVPPSSTEESHVSVNEPELSADVTTQKTAEDLSLETQSPVIADKSPAKDEEISFEESSSDLPLSHTDKPSLGGQTEIPISADDYISSDRLPSTDLPLSQAGGEPESGDKTFIQTESPIEVSKTTAPVLEKEEQDLSESAFAITDKPGAIDKESTEADGPSTETAVMPEIISSHETTPELNKPDSDDQILIEDVSSETAKPSDDVVPQGTESPVDQKKPSLEEVQGITESVQSESKDELTPPKKTVSVEDAPTEEDSKTPLPFEVAATETPAAQTESNSVLPEKEKPSDGTVSEHVTQPQTELTTASSHEKKKPSEVTEPEHVAVPQTEVTTTSDESVTVVSANDESLKITTARPADENASSESEEEETIKVSPVTERHDELKTDAPIPDVNKTLVVQTTAVPSLEESSTLSSEERETSKPEASITTEKTAPVSSIGESEEKTQSPEVASEISEEDHRIVDKPTEGSIPTSSSDKPLENGADIPKPIVTEEQSSAEESTPFSTTIHPLFPHIEPSRTTSRPQLNASDKVDVEDLESIDSSTSSASPTTAQSITNAPTSHYQPPGYGQVPPQYPSYAEDEYTDEDETEVFGPGTCRYGGKLFVSAQQIPRDDPCDFCFCFRSDIICLQQSCPPPISGCHEEPISGFCCPRYECPVSMATTLNITTSTTTTSTTLPPHFLHHAYRGAAAKNGCHIGGKSFKVGDKIDSASGPCMHCTCGGDGQMKCDPKTCSPEPMLQQMIAVVASRRR